MKIRELSKIDIKFNLVVEVIVEEKTFIQIPTDENYTIDIIKLSDKDFRQKTFEYKRYIKSLSEPFERISIFETLDENGIFSLKKYNKILKTRLKSGEELEGI